MEWDQIICKDDCLNAAMQQREELLELRQQMMAAMNHLTDKLNAVNELIKSDPWIIANNIPFWQWTPEKGFVVPAPKGRKGRKNRLSALQVASKTRYGHLNKSNELTNKDNNRESSKPLKFTYYPDIMEEKAYSRH